MIWLLIALIVLICFASVLLFGAPYLPTLKPQVKAALDLIDPKPGQTLLELGCGDGKVLVAAAERGMHAVGYELNPLMAAAAWLRTWRYRKRVKVVWGNFWQADWPPADAIFTFLLPRYMKKLDVALEDYPHKPVKLASFAFKVPGKQAVAERHGVFLYDYR